MAELECSTSDDEEDLGGPRPRERQDSLEELSRSENEASWHEAVDPATGKTYWWSAVTQRAVWTIPRHEQPAFDDARVISCRTAWHEACEKLTSAQHSLVEMCAVEKDLLLQARSESGGGGGAGLAQADRISSFRARHRVRLPGLQQEVDSAAERLDGALRAATKESGVGVGRRSRHAAGRLDHSVASARAEQAALVQQLAQMLAAAERENVEMRRVLGQQPQTYA